MSASVPTAAVLPTTTPPPGKGGRAGRGGGRRGPHLPLTHASPPPAPGCPTRPLHCRPLGSLSACVPQPRMKKATTASANTGKTLTCRRPDLLTPFLSHCPQWTGVPGTPGCRGRPLLGATTSGVSHHPGASHTPRLHPGHGSRAPLGPRLSSPSSGHTSSFWPTTRLLRTHFRLMRLDRPLLILTPLGGYGGGGVLECLHSI